MMNKHHSYLDYEPEDGEWSSTFHEFTTEETRMNRKERAKRRLDEQVVDFYKQAIINTNQCLHKIFPTQ